jgi:hypothetical protein
MGRHPLMKVVLAGIVCLMAMGPGLLASGCKAQCEMGCGGSLRISFGDYELPLDRFSVEVNGTIYSLSYDGEAPPAGVDEHRANHIEVPVYNQPFEAHVRWLVDGLVWFEETPHVEWDTHEVCGATCYSGQATMQLPAALPDGTMLGDLPRPCSLYGCVNQITVHLTEPVIWQKGMGLSAGYDSPCVLRGCVYDPAGVAPCVATLSTSANVGDCAAIPGAIDTIIFKTTASSFELEWTKDHSSLFTATVTPQFAAPIIPTGATCSPGCRHGEASLTPPTSSPGTAIDAGSSHGTSVDGG